MSYYVYTNRGYFAKSHLVVGTGDYFISACGIRWLRRTNPWKEVKKQRVRPIGRKSSGIIWPNPKEAGVTCSRCLEVGYPPYTARQKGGPNVGLHRRGHDIS